MKKSTKKNILNISTVIILIGIMVWLLSKSTDELNFSNIKEYLIECNYGYLFLAFLCWVGFILFEALSLHIILKSFGQKVKFRSAIAYSTADTYYSAITPSATGGQPASAYYMVKDGVSAGASGFSLIFNLAGYTSAIIILGIIALVIDINMFLNLSFFVKFIIILGFFSQVILLIFFITCMRWHKGVKKLGYLIVGILYKIKIIKKKDKWINRVESTVSKYKNCYEDFKKHKFTLVPVIIFNVLQRLSQILISVFVCKSACDCSFIDLFVMQTLVVLGYNSIPLPGGVGAFEYLYLKIYSISLPSSFIIVAMMVTRVISYYISLVASGIYTIIYHILQIKKSGRIIEKETSNSNLILESDK